MNNQTKMKRSFIATVAAIGLTATSSLATAQTAQDVGDVGSAAKQAVDQATQQATGSATERGLNRAAQGLLQGQAPRDAVRSGLGEAAQSSLETPQQTYNREMSTQVLRNQQLRNQSFGQNVPAGQVIQRDAQGRLFYRDQSGNIVYGNSLAQSTLRADRFGAQYDARQDGQGVVINQVRDNGFAGNAGLQQGDIITGINGQSVQNQQVLQQQIGNLQPGQDVQMTVIRDGNEQTINATTSDAFGQSAIDRRSVAKPAMDESELAKDVKQLKQQVEELQNELKELKRSMKTE